ncbi:hypothetical protein [Streptomyces sp. AK02-01A]|uniref:hypothetical protein n=1 Tax=Streptomyces sp. AK02-01A TaxID=3028648 RepID=UPI0029A0531F|nr:hypothetical protein [Streptomyces sp. AK02-01A]MDX3851000.1 hypothetical protein [Streptomyces sp. AK02-01A]
MARTSAVSLTRGVQVEPVAVRGVAVLRVRSVAERFGTGALPETVAEAVTAATGPGREDAEDVRALRPVRIESRTVVVPVRVAGRLVMAAAQAGAYAALNGDGRTVRPSYGDCTGESC